MIVALQISGLHPTFKTTENTNKCERDAWKMESEKIVKGRRINNEKENTIFNETGIWYCRKPDISFLVRFSHTTI